jgi:hypothetical protein
MRTMEPIDLQIKRDLLGDASDSARAKAPGCEKDAFLPRRMSARELMRMPGGWSLAELGDEFPDEPYFDNRGQWTALARSRKVPR